MSKDLKGGSESSEYLGKEQRKDQNNGIRWEYAWYVKTLKEARQAGTGGTRTRARSDELTGARL